jgi:hypothetical protein
VRTGAGAGDLKCAMPNYAARALLSRVCWSGRTIHASAKIAVFTPRRGVLGCLFLKSWTPVKLEMLLVGEESWLEL